MWTLLIPLSIDSGARDRHYSVKLRLLFRWPWTRNHFAPLKTGGRTLFRIARSGPSGLEPTLIGYNPKATILFFLFV